MLFKKIKCLLLINPAWPQKINFVNLIKEPIKKNCIFIEASITFIYVQHCIWLFIPPPQHVKLPFINMSLPDQTYVSNSHLIFKIVYLIYWYEDFIEKLVIDVEKTLVIVSDSPARQYQICNKICCSQN